MAVGENWTVRKKKVAGGSERKYSVVTPKQKQKTICRGREKKKKKGTSWEPEASGASRSFRPGGKTNREKR